MRISLFLAALLLPTFSYATEDAGHGHEEMLFHKFVLDADIGNSNEGTLRTWDFHGWIGGDYNKLYLKSEGEYVDGATHSAEFQALYSHNIAEFWDAQIGLRQDVQPESITYFTTGLEGMLPYFFETEAHLFVSENGDFSLRTKFENDFLLTQEIILSPHLEANFYAQDVNRLEVGQGLSDAEIGLQTRWEITRKFAPYIDLSYERKFGETSSIAKKHGEDNDDFIAAAGIRLMF